MDTQTIIKVFTKDDEIPQRIMMARVIEIKGGLLPDEAELDCAEYIPYEISTIISGMNNIIFVAYEEAK